MANAAYDLSKLVAYEEIDVGTAYKDSGDPQGFFDELERFVTEPKEYFRQYNPTVVVFDDETREYFLGDVCVFKERCAALGLTPLVSALTDLEKAVEDKSVGALSDWLMSLEAKAEGLAKLLMTARVTEETPAPNKPEKATILAVDDKPELLTALVNMLKPKYTAMAVTSAAAALKVVEKHTPQLFLLDIEMPVMDGYQLASQLRAQSRFAKTPIIFLTGKNTRDAVLAAMANGGNDYVVKPVAQEILYEKIEKCLAATEGR